jgi:dephospho-CoA kinase
MILIGITGILGSGKTTVSGLLRKEGLRVIDLDKLAKSAMKREGILRAVKRAFGNDCVVGRQVDTEKLKDAAFKDRATLTKLESIVHPEVRKELLNKVEKLKKTGTKAVIIDAPLLFEGGLYNMLDKTVVVSTDMASIGKRLALRGMEAKDIARRLSFQIPLKEKEKRADHVVNNNGTKEDLKKELAILLQRIKQWEVK